MAPRRRTYRELRRIAGEATQTRSMEAADILYGVTLEPGGSSNVISEHVKG